MNKARHVRSETPPHLRLELRWRVLISVLLAMHVVAVFMPPFSFQTSSPSGESPAAGLVMDLAGWYINAAFLNHGYAFFAPDPGPSHLVRYRLEFADGREPREEMFPDLRRHRPRLLYHRHFMLSEQLHAAYAPPQPPADLPDSMLEGWRRGRLLYEQRWKSFEDHLLARYGAERIRMVRVQHRLPPPEPQPNGIDLRAASSFVELERDAVPAPPSFSLPPGSPAAGQPPLSPPPSLHLGPYPAGVNP